MLAWNANNDSTIANANVGSRLLVFDLLPCQIHGACRKILPKGSGLVAEAKRRKANKEHERSGNLFGSITNIENCKSAILDAAKGKTYRTEVRKVVENADEYAARLCQMLAEKTYAPSDYRIITVHDGACKKTRVVQVPEFWPDQCVHHALMRVLQPILMRRMYYWNCGSLPDRGIKHAQKGVERATLDDQKNAKYACKLDIVHCYASIPNDRLKAAFRRIIKDAAALWLIDVIIDSCEGLPIGNYTSAWFANFYLTSLDWFIKQKYHIKHYIRYMDDMILTAANKKKLHKAVRAVFAFAEEELGVKLHENWNVFKVRREGDGNRNRPIDFVSFCFCLGYTTLRKRNALAIMRQSRRIQKIEREGRRIPHKMAAGFISRAGQLTHCNGAGLKRKYVDVVHIKNLKEVVRSESKRRCSAERIQHKRPSNEKRLRDREAVRKCRAVHRGRNERVGL